MWRDWFSNPWVFILFAALPALSVLSLLAARRRRRDLARLGQLAALGTTLRKSRWRRWLHAFCLSWGMASLIAGIAGPNWGRDERVPLTLGRDLIVLLDLSRSMAAQDVAPNRLGRARDGLPELADTVQRRGGHRLGLVVFAAKAKVICPLTHDYDFFRDEAEKLDAAHLPMELRPGPDGPGSGTRMGEGLRAAVAAHDGRFRGYQSILMISDGDDPGGDDEWLSGVPDARAAGIPVYTVGVGDPEVGGRIPGLRYQDKEVWSRLQEKPLEEIARRTGGEYTPARKEPLPLGDLFRDRIERGPVRETTDDAVLVRRQRYPWFFGAGLALLAMALVIADRRPRREDQRV